jgi:phage shock protein C
MNKLKISNTNKVLFGVCGGVAEYFGWDPTMVRVLWVVFTFFGIGSPILIYIILLILMPKY